MEAIMMGVCGYVLGSAVVLWRAKVYIRDLNKYYQEKLEEVNK